jgi:histidinol-phosphatase
MWSASYRHAGGRARAVMHTAGVFPDGDDLALALRMADRADVLTLAAFEAEAFAFTDKGDGSPVTDTDIAVERALLELVARSRPDDGFLGEETGLSNDGPRVWIVDPIDGTRSFVDGGRAWGTLIALSDHGRLAVGVASAPAAGSRWWGSAHRAQAERSGQAPRELCVTSTEELDGARWTCHPSIDSLTASDRARLQPLIDRCGPAITPTTHGALMVAEGDVDFFVQLSGGPWDFAAVAVIVQSAGGSFSYLDGSHALRPKGQALFTNGALHPLVLAAINIVG